MNKDIQDINKVEAKEEIGVVVLINSSESGRSKDNILPNNKMPGKNSILLKEELLKEPELIEIAKRMKLILTEFLED